MEEENKAIVSDEEVSYTTNTSEHIEAEESNPVTTQESSQAEIKSDEEFVKPKKPIFMKILFGVIGFLLILLITGIVLYFTGFFEPKEEHKKAEEPVAHEVVAKPEPTPVVDNNPKFEIKDINSKKLNDQLANLTNKNISEEKKNLENEKKKEELLKQKSLDDEKRNLENEKAQQAQIKEEIKVDNKKEKSTIEPSAAEDKKTQDDNLLPKNTTSKNELKNNIKEEKIEKNTKENSTNNQFLLFINVAKIKGELYKKYLDKITAVNPNVRLCRDEKNKIEIYFGPFEKNEDRTELLNKLIKNKFTEAYGLEFTQEEFDKRCNY